MKPHLICAFLINLTIFKHVTWRLFMSGFVVTVRVALTVVDIRASCVDIRGLQQ